MPRPFSPFSGSAPRLAPRAFTLIELLTVIAIIGVLAAILIPTVARVRETGRATKCLGNLRTLASSLLLAAQDNRGVFPIGLDTSRPTNDPNRDWMNHLSANYSLAWRADATGRRNSEIFNCPTTGREGTGLWPATRPDYGANVTVVGSSNSAAHPRPRNLSAIREPSRLVLIADTAGNLNGIPDVMGSEFLLNGRDFATQGFPSGLASIAAERPAPRHPAPSGSSYAGGSFNAAFVDGHVERVSVTDPRLSTLEGRTLMFAAP